MGGEKTEFLFEIGVAFEDDLLISCFEGFWPSCRFCRAGGSMPTSGRFKGFEERWDMARHGWFSCHVCLVYSWFLSHGRLAGGYFFLSLGRRCFSTGWWLVDTPLAANQCLSTLSFLAFWAEDC